MRQIVDIPDKDKLWKYIVEKGKEKEAGYITNKFTYEDIETIISTMEFFNATETWIRQTLYDLAGPPRYRLFDWLGMCVMSRNDDNRELNNIALQVLVYSWLKVNGEPERFIQDLRDTDYQIDESWKKVEIP